MRIMVSMALVAMMGLFLAACSSPPSPLFATNVPVAKEEAKYGESVCRWVFGIQFGGCSVDEAIKEADITQVQTVNQYSFDFYPFYNSVTIGVRGK